jgi:hypothetical protein
MNRSSETRLEILIAIVTIGILFILGYTLVASL